MKNASDTMNRISEEGRNIFSLIQKKGPITKNDIMLITGIKLSTLNRIMQPLEDTGFIVECGIGESSGGRKPVLYDVDYSYYLIAGIDISRTYVQVVVTNLKMKILFKRQSIMDESCSPDKTVKLVTKVLNDYMRKQNAGSERFLGAGAGAVGPLDRFRGIILNPVNFLAEGWVDIPLRKMLEDELKIPVFIDNGANTAVLAEFLFGDGRNFKNIAYFNCGVGIRTGAISSGSIVRTINDTEDAFGHMIVDVDGELCSCGNYGCIECYSSIASITRKFKSALKKGRVSIIAKPLEEINFIDICRAADEKDELAKEIVTTAATIFGSGLANYINLLNPGLVILSGPLIRYSNLFYQVCTKVASQKHYLNSESRIIFSKGGSFKDNAISIGAAAMVIESSVLKNKMPG